MVQAILGTGIHTRIKHLSCGVRISIFSLGRHTACKCVQLAALIPVMGVPSTHSQHNLFKTPIEIAVSVETLVQIEDTPSFHSHGTHSVVLPQSEPKSLLPLCMSLPRANYDPRRVCLSPFPEFSLGRHKRTIGIYLAGALVSPFLISSWAQSFSPGPHNPSSPLQTGHF